MSETDVLTVNLRTFSSTIHQMIGIYVMATVNMLNKKMWRMFVRLFVLQSLHSFCWFELFIKHRKFCWHCCFRPFWVKCEKLVAIVFHVKDSILFICFKSLSLLLCLCYMSNAIDAFNISSCERFTSFSKHYFINSVKLTERTSIGFVSVINILMFLLWIFLVVA